MGSADSKLSQRIRGLRERTIDDIPSVDGRRGDQNARPNAPEDEPRGDRIRGGRED